MTEERIHKLATELSKFIYIKDLDDATKIGKLIRLEMEREYRRGYVAALADERKNVR